MAVWRAIEEAQEIQLLVDGKWTLAEQLQPGANGPVLLREWQDKAEPGDVFRLVRRNAWVLDESSGITEL